jgi:Dyp-type peroxidase family
MTIQLATDDIQGNILTGYKFRRVAHLFGRIEAKDVALWKSLLSQLAPQMTMSQWAKKPETTLNIGFSARAVALLQRETATEIASRFPAFSQGMANRARELGDTDEFDNRWEERHVWLAVHAREDAPLDARVGELRRIFGRIDLFEQSPRGAAIEKNGHWYEHFGFRDDISYPAVDGTPRLDPSEIPGRGKFQNGAWLPIAPGEFVLGQVDEAGRNALDGLSANAQRLLRNGSFGVFRHLRQHVPAFREFLDRQSGPRLGADALAACMMGRRANGEPLAGKPEELSAFTYDGDERGARCPLGAHVRRANPRGKDGRHRLIRRGMSYGAPLAEGATDTADRGLWFVAINANIEDQFEFVQKRWLNSPEFGTLSDARDPVVGAGASRGFVIEGDVSAARQPVLLTNLPNFVTCHGGQYYFLPGRRGLEFLCSESGASASVISLVHEAS